jgi:uncharacterized protein YacL
MKRFGLVLSKDFHEKWKKYGLQFLTMFGIMAVLLTWIVYDNVPANSTKLFDDTYSNMELLQYASLLFLGFGIFYASTLMDSMREKTKRISCLMTPASHFEKFISRWLIVTIGYIIAFFIALWLADAVRVTFLSYKFPEFDFPFLDFNSLIEPETGTHNRYYVFSGKFFFGIGIGFYLLLQSLFILGATFWERASFIKTFSAGVVVVLSFLLLNYWMIKVVYHDMEGFGKVMDALAPRNTTQETGNTVMLLIACFLSFCALLNWVIAFFRFRESEIIKRL